MEESKTKKLMEVMQNIQVTAISMQTGGEINLTKLAESFEEAAASLREIDKDLGE